MTTFMPCLIFNNLADEAVAFYMSVFPNSKIVSVARFTEGDLHVLQRLPENERPKMGSAKRITFEISGQRMIAGNGGAHFARFNHNMSLYLTCNTQAEIDDLHAKLAKGGTVEECGWVRDKYGVPWQIVPRFVEDVFSENPDSDAAQRVSDVIFTSKKLDLDRLQKAYRGDA
jgi:predicted 3-demethylubiquinone-9 3-methyltransferase (glyoxalase superfamily)